MQTQIILSDTAAFFYIYQGRVSILRPKCLLRYNLRVGDHPPAAGTL